MTGNRDAGQQAFFLGELTEMRLRLGLSKQALADILDVAIATLYRWESYGPLGRLNDSNAERVDLFVRAAQAALVDVPDFREHYITLAKAAQHLGFTQELLFSKYREGAVPMAEDFGFLGIFISHAGFAELKKQIRKSW